MKGFARRGSFLLVALLTISCLALVSCGSGSGSGSAAVSGTSASTGSVAILLTDGPTADFSEVLVTVTKIELLSDYSRATISNKEETYDLLTLKNETTLVTIDDGVPVGWYSKIRLTVKEVWVREIGSESYEQVKLPANGKIDLNPRVPFYVAPGEMLTVQLDLDAEKSIHLHETGSGKYMFRPVVFITVIDGVPPEKLVRIHGYVGTISEGGFTVCPDIATSDGNGDLCTQAYVTGETSFFSSDKSGEPVQFSDLNPGDEVTVVGLMRMKPETTHYDADADSASWLGIDGIVVEIGGFLEKLRGTAIPLLPVNELDQFPFDIMNGSGISGTSQVQIQQGTKIYSPQGDPLEPSSITYGTVAEVDGILLLSSVLDPADVINSAFILIDTDVEPAEKRSGTIAAGGIDESNSTFDLVLTESSDTVCVDASGAPIYLAEETGTSYTFTEGAFGDLKDGMEVDAYGSAGAECFIADTIVAYVGTEP